MEKQRTSKTSAVTELFSWTRALTIALAVLVCCNTFFFRLSGVVGSSMCDTLEERDQLVLQIIGYDEPERGDVLVCTSDYRDGEALVKRVIGLAGDMVDISADGYMMINGVKLDEPYAKEPMDAKKIGDQTYPLKVADDHIFVVGDNRNGSTDSRWKTVGQIEKDRIIGKVLFRVWPLHKLGIVS